MKTNKEIKEWILKNCVNREGDIDLIDLDFGDFKGELIQKADDLDE